MKTPQIMISRLKAITDTEEKAIHIATLIELANANKIKDDFDVKSHIAKVLTNENDETASGVINFDYKAITKPIIRQLSQEIREARFLKQIEKQVKKYGIDKNVALISKGENK